MSDNIIESRVGRLEREVAHAIRLLREQSDMDLATAKSVVDEIVARGL